MTVVASYDTTMNLTSNSLAYYFNKLAWSRRTHALGALALKLVGKVISVTLLPLIVTPSCASLGLCANAPAKLRIG
jgi:hypothetical protein